MSANTAGYFCPGCGHEMAAEKVTQARQDFDCPRCRAHTISQFIGGRHTQLGVLPVNINTVDLLDNALCEALDKVAAVNQRLLKETALRIDAEARANLVDREELSNAREKLRDAFDALKGLIHKVDPDGDDFMDSEF